MIKFKEYLKKENIIEDLLERYKEAKNERDFLNKVLESLLKANNLNANSEFDVISNAYQKNLNSKERKALGEFYTPLSVVNYILNAIGYTDNNKIENRKLIDISCGSGSFIIPVVKMLFKRLKNITNLNNITESSLKQAKKIIKWIQEAIYGVDINPIACILCQINIHYVLFEIYRKIRKIEPEYKLPMFNIINSDALTLSNLSLFDFVVGNPPYLFIRDIPKEQRELIESKRFETNDGQYDYYQIFIEIGIRLLKSQGKLGYIVPDSLLALSNRLILRRYIYNTTKIKEIYYTGPKFDDPVVSNIILILEKESNGLEREKNSIKIILIDNQEKQILQKVLKKWNFKFLIHLNDTDISIIEHLDKEFPKLKDLNKNDGYIINLNRGVELAKTGEIIYCEKCKTYFPIPRKDLLCQKCGSQLKIEHIEKIIQKNIPKNRNESFKSFLFAINRYNIKEKKYIDITKNGINYKDLKFYEDRIIIRQLSQNNLICATYDKNISLTSQSFYNLKILQTPIKEFNHSFLLGIINSTLLSYYFIKSFGSYKKLFPRILIEKIKNLPIKIPETEKEKKLAREIIKQVNILLEAKDKSINLLEKVQQEIDSLIFNLFQISNNDQNYILNYMKNL